MAPSNNRKQLSFMNCIIKVKNRKSGWQNTVMKVLSDIRHVKFTMDDKGIVMVSGRVDPQILLKHLGKSGKTVELRWLQFGECSDNLYPPHQFCSSNSDFSGSTSTANGFIHYGRQENYAAGEPRGPHENYIERHGWNPFETQAKSMYGRSNSSVYMTPCAPPPMD